MALTNKERIGRMLDALAAGLKPEQIQTIEVAGLKAAKLQASFGKKRSVR
jgi:hypothetical protein